jgi:methanogenic corrinoid protein MtbC1
MNDIRTGRQLIELIADLKEREAMALIKDMLADGVEPTRVMDICIQGMHQVGQRFENRQYFISALIMAGDIMRQATEILEINFLHRKSDESKGVILLGTIQGDIHDLGKNLFGILARCEGFEVVDLGVDVAPERFLEQAKKVKPDLIGISCLLTSVLPELKTALDLLRRELPGHHARVIIGGHCIDEHIFRHVQSDYWADNAVSGLAIVKEVLSKKSRGA